MNRSPRLIVPLVAAALLAVGCGSDTPPATESTTAPTTAAQTTAAQAAASPTTAAPTTAAPTTAAPTAASSSPVTTSSPLLDDKGCITEFDAEADYFPDKSTITRATNFSITYHRSYQVLTVKEPEPGAKPESYVLLRCGAPKPTLTGDLAKATVVTTPVHSLYSSSTSHLPNFVILDQLDVLTGVGSKSLISEQEVLDHVASADVVEFAPTQVVDAEKVTAGKPDALLTAGFSDPAFTMIAKAGIPVLANAEWLESDPLGRAEWVKYFAALTGTEAAATTFFEEVVASYEKTAALVKDAPKVEAVLGQPFQGTWYVPGGKSHFARLLADAGGTSAWASDASTGAVSADFETVFAKSGKAPVWLATTTWTTKADALKEESRFATFEAFKTGEVWNASKSVNAAGGNNYYELGVARPDLVLAELASILHPELAPDHAFTFYLQLK